MDAWENDKNGRSRLLIVSDLLPDKCLHDARRSETFILPEIIQFAEDFFVFDVAAVVLA